MGGRTSTHVANAYHQTIWVKVDAERQHVLEASASVKASVGVDGIEVGEEGSLSAKFEYNIIKVGFTRIPPKTFQRFDVDMRGANTAYISVFYIDEKTHLPLFLAHALPRREDKSVIINKQGTIVDAVYGTVWQEES